MIAWKEYTLFDNGTSNIITLIICFAIFCLCIKRFIFNEKSQIPKNCEYPPISDESMFRTMLIVLQGNILPYFLHLHQKLGSTFRFNLRNPYKMIVISTDTNLIRKILDDRNSFKPLRYNHLKILHGDGDDIFTSNGDFPYHSRKGMMPAFSPKMIKQRGEIINKAIDEFIIHRLDQLSSADVSSSTLSFDPSREMIKLTIDIICKAAFQYEMSDTEAESLYKNLEVTVKEFRMQVIPLRLRLARFIPNARRATEAGFKTKAFGMKILEHYRNLEDPIPGTIIHMISKSPHYKSDSERANDIAVLFFAGHDTTGNTIAWTLIALAQNPSIQKELNQHLLSLPESERPESKLLHNIVKESMRMFPVAAITSLRVTTKDIIVPQENGKKNLFIPKNSNFTFSNFLVCRDPNIFSNPDKFDPSRWDDYNSMDSSNAFWPFSIGRRGCIGQSLAMFELHNVLAKLCSKFNFEIDVEGNYDYKLIYRPVGYKLRATKL